VGGRGYVGVVVIAVAAVAAVSAFAAVVCVVVPVSVVAPAAAAPRLRTPRRTLRDPRLTCGFVPVEDSLAEGVTLSDARTQ
ncbi:hypothetical protein, partial [Streptomyces sp. HB-N217]|uniref:hypothetical protein n=1 Tax=Streptomyces sp. HB-N217 TaxID=2792016 RepID=UPI001E28EE66